MGRKRLPLPGVLTREPVQRLPSIIHSIIQPFIGSSIHSFIHSSIHPSIHSFIRSVSQSVSQSGEQNGTGQDGKGRQGTAEQLRHVMSRGGWSGGDQFKHSFIDSFNNSSIQTRNVSNSSSRLFIHGAFAAAPGVPGGGWYKVLLMSTSSHVPGTESDGTTAP